MGSRGRMGAGVIFLLFVLLVFVVIAVGALWAIRAGLWARETGPAVKAPAAEAPDQGARPRERRRHLAAEDEGQARFDVSDRERDAAKR
jgi:Na+-transporting methylmalonyl-CoA/oxaloacetate decarboxylase gamma subunit